MSETTTYVGTLNVLDCADCNMSFGITPRFEKDRRDDHKTFYCPLGHHNYYPYKSDKQKLREQRDTARRGKAAAEGRACRAREDAEHEKRRSAAARGQVTKIKNRISKGVCPCCNRTFVNVSRHMKSQHPEFIGTAHVE